MKGFINKRDKIKWEDTPFQPEFTGEKLAEMVSGELSLDDLKDVKYLTDTPPDGSLLMYQDHEDAWVPSTVYLNNLEDVSNSHPQTGQILRYDQNGYAFKNVTPTLNMADDVNIASPAEGDTLVYDATAGEWKNKARDEWELVSTLTADGTDRYLAGDVPECISLMVEGVTAAGASQLTLGLSVSFDGGSTYETVGAVSAGIDTSVKYMRFFYMLNCGIWMGFNTSALNVTNATATLQSRFESFKTGGTFTKIRFFVPLNEVISDGSEFKIYIKRK